MHVKERVKSVFVSVSLKLFRAWFPITLVANVIKCALSMAHTCMYVIPYDYRCMSV